LSACLRFLAWRNACGFRLRFCSLLLWCCQFGNVVIVLPWLPSNYSTNYLGRAGGVDSFVIVWPLINALSSGVSSHSQISSWPLLSIRLKLFFVIIHFLKFI